MFCSDDEAPLEAQVEQMLMAIFKHKQQVANKKTEQDIQVCALRCPCGGIQVCSLNDCIPAAHMSLVAYAPNELLSTDNNASQRWCPAAASQKQPVLYQHQPTVRASLTNGIEQKP